MHLFLHLFVLVQICVTQIHNNDWLLSLLQVYYWRETSQLPWLSVSRRTKSKGFAASGPRLSGDLTGLTPYSNYRIYIVVANRRYEGPASSTIEFQTPEGGMLCQPIVL